MRKLAHSFTKYVENSTSEVLGPAIMGECYPEDIKLAESTKPEKNNSN